MHRKMSILIGDIIIVQSFLSPNLISVHRMHSTRFYHFTMFDNLAAYYHENVVSSFVAYRNISKDKTAGCSRDLRMALTAASALFHLREHLPTRTLTRTEIERLCPNYALLGDIVNASKHKVISNQTPHGQPLVNDAKNLEEQLIVIEYEDDLGTYRFVQKTVVVKLNDGSVQNLINVLTNVMNFWEQHMQSLGICRLHVHLLTIAISVREYDLNVNRTN
jgi:hypothetical protein